MSRQQKLPPIPARRRRNDAERLERILSGPHACVFISTVEEDEALSAVREAALALRRPLWVWTAVSGVQEGLIAESTPVANTADPIKALEYFLARDDKPLCAMLDLLPHLRDAKVRRALRNALSQISRYDRGTRLILIDASDDLPAEIAAYATRFELSLPDREELRQIVRSVVREQHAQRPVRIDIKKREFEAILRNLQGLSRRQARQVILECIESDRALDAEDLNHVLAEKRRLLASGGLLEYIETPVDLSEIGGLRRLKRWLRQRRNALSDDAERFGLPAPRGVLMLGVQGAGKSLCARAIAAAWQRPLLRMDVGALYDKYVGESERRLRDALRQAEMMAPIVLWIDEIEKAFASAAAQSTDGGLSKRMFGTLLTWMQEHTAPVFLVATANDIEALPPELLRKGRFDEIFFVDLPRPAVRREIFAIHLRKRGRDPAKFDLDALAEASEGFSGAEIEQAVISALHEAFDRGEKLSTEHILEAVRTSPPLSVTMREKIEALRAWAADRCVPAD